MRQTGKQQSTKTCGRCAYWTRLKSGSINTGLVWSKYGRCAGYEHDHSMGNRGRIHENNSCLLDPQQWMDKELVRFSPSQRRQANYDTHPGVFNKHCDGSRNWRYQREWALERERELKQK